MVAVDRVDPKVGDVEFGPVFVEDREPRRACAFIDSLSEPEIDLLGRGAEETVDGRIGSFEFGMCLNRCRSSRAGKREKHDKQRA
jgi:hypothetical protein